MLDHHIQRGIVYRLAFASALRFSELKPQELENKAFDYHLKKVVVAGFVEKTEDGAYRLTGEGRRIWRVSQKQAKNSNLYDRAYSTLLLAIRRKSDGAWLLYRRRTHPMLGLSGFMHAQPCADQDVTQTAAEVCREQTGLSGEFVVHGHGYFRVYHKNLLESFTHFTLLKCTDIQGELHQNSELAEYYWDTDPDFSAPEMLPNSQILRKMSEAPVGLFAEKTFDI